MDFFNLEGARGELKGRCSRCVLAASVVGIVESPTLSIVWPKRITDSQVSSTCGQFEDKCKG
jgi:hypothetical protein